MEKFKSSILVGIVFVFGSGLSAFAAANDRVQCVAKGKSLSTNTGGLLDAQAILAFTDTVDERGLRVLSDIEARVQASPKDSDTIYIGTFNIDSLTENPNYRPRKYRGYSQFRNFDATDTSESAEPRMWGELLVRKDTSRGVFPAHYIFQAGDHLGGTLHLSCEVQD